VHVTRDQRPALVTLGLAIVTAAFLAFAPLATSTSCETTETSAACTASSESLLEHEGGSLLVLLAVPVALAAIGVARTQRKVLLGVAIALTALAALAALSIGVFYVPTVVAAWVAHARTRGTMGT
jgi:hypothetical protein